MILPATLWSALVLDWTAAAILAALGATLLARPVRDETARWANVMFSLWWFGLAMSSFVSGLNIPMVAADLPLTLLVGLSFVTSAAVTVGLAGLLYYLIYLAVGRGFPMWPIVAFYALFCGWIISSHGEWRPVGVEVTAWGTSFIHEQPYTAMYRTVALLVLVGPQLVGGFGLLTLAARLPQSAARVRMSVAATGVLVYLLNALAAPVYPPESATWQLVAQLVPILVGIGVLAAYRPPQWLPWRLPPELPAARREASPP